jgi:hypothetical protein
MKSQKSGKSISSIEVLNISIHGFWIMVYDKEYFLPFQDYPWFKEANIEQIQNVELIHEEHLHWPDLDIDLELESLENLEKYPLVYTHKA